MNTIPESLVTATWADTMWQAAGKRYQDALADVARYALLAMALRIREVHPTATHLVAGASDQGDYLTPTAIIDPECGFDDNEVEESEVLDNLWAWVGDLSTEDHWGLWMPFVIADPEESSRTDPTGRSWSWVLDLDLILFYGGDGRVAQS